MNVRSYTPAFPLPSRLFPADSRKWPLSRCKPRHHPCSLIVLSAKTTKTAKLLPLRCASPLHLPSITSRRIPKAGRAHSSNVNTSTCIPYLHYPAPAPTTQRHPLTLICPLAQVTHRQRYPRRPQDNRHSPLPPTAFTIPFYRREARQPPATHRKRRSPTALSPCHDIPNRPLPHSLVNLQPRRGPLSSNLFRIVCASHNTDGA